MEKTVFAVDPGTSKCGVALVHRGNDGKLEMLWHDVFPTEEMAYKLHEAYAIAQFQLVIVGGGTNSQPVVHCIRDHMPSMGMLVVDERDTTLEARARYWEQNRRKGWRKLLPATLQTPPEPYDDYVAYILAERVLLGG